MNAIIVIVSLLLSTVYVNVCCAETNIYNPKAQHQTFNIGGNRADFNIDVASVYIEADEAEYMDCTNRVNGKQGFAGKWEECKKQRPKTAYIDNYNLYTDCREGLEFGMSTRLGLVQLGKDCGKYKPKPYQGSKFFSFVRIKNADNKPILDLKACLIVSDGKQTANGIFKIPFALDSQKEIVTSKQRVILTEWEPLNSAMCISGRYSDAKPRWILYVGEPWHVTLNDGFFGGRVNDFVYGYWGDPTPLFVSPKRGEGEDLGECIKCAQEALRGMK